MELSAAAILSDRSVACGRYETAGYVSDCYLLFSYIYISFAT